MRRRDCRVPLISELERSLTSQIKALYFFILIKKTVINIFGDPAVNIGKH